MDCLPTQVYEEDDFAPTQRIAHSVQGGEVQQVGILIVESKAYRINTGINTIGRSRTSNININNQTVSKNHAEIEATGGQSSAWICDLKSSNQTKLNNLTLQPGRSYELKDGSRIEFGHVSAVYKVLQPMDESIVPETPAPSRQKIIPVTPDSSLINSSAEDVSTIAATQDTEGKSIFRRPSLPVQRQSTGSRTSFVHDSSLDESTKENTKVAKDVGVERTAKEAGRKRTGNRSQSMLNEIVRNDGKKRKAEAEEEAPVNKRRKSSAKTVNRRQSATILDFLGKREESPASGGSPVDGLIAKRAVVNVTRLSQNTPPAADEESDGYKINRNRRKVNQASSSSSKVKEADEKAAEKSTQKIRITRKQTKHEDVTSFVGEESQEVEMIMSNALPRDETEPNVARESKAKNTRSRRANVQKTAAWSMPESVANTRSTRAGRSSQSSQSSESLVEEEDQNTAKTAKRRGRPRKIVKKPMKSKAEKNESDEMQIEGSSSSENNSSIASHVSTPSRTRRSTSTSLLNTPLAQKGKHKILFTGITTEYGKLLSKLGASQVEDPAKCTVLVTDKVRRTLKFLCALAQAVPIVSIDWLIESERAGRFLEMDNYILKDPASEAKFGFKLRGSLEKARERKFLEGYTVIVTPNVSPPPVQELKHMIVSSGGKPLVRPPTSWPKNAVIVSREEDLANAKKFLAKAPKDVTIQSTEFILTGILRQELNFAKHKLT